MPGTGDAVRALARTGQDDQVYVVYERSLPVLRDGGTGVPVRTYTGFSGHPACHAISAENSLAAIGSDDHILRLWNWQEKNPATEIPFYNRLPTCCTLTPDGKLAAAGLQRGHDILFQCSRRAADKRIPGIQAGSHCLCHLSGRQDSCYRGRRWHRDTPGHSLRENSSGRSRAPPVQ